MIPIGNTAFFRKHCSSSTRPFFRIGVTLAGFILWVLLQGLLSRVFGFIEGGILKYSVTSFISLAVILPFWNLVPLTAGRLLGRDSAAVSAASLPLFIPFIVIAFLYGLQYTGIPSIWPVFAAALFLLAASEEIICRGFIMDALSFRCNRITGLLLSSLVFALLHLGNNHVSFLGIVNIFIVGALFGLLRFVTDGLVYPILIHWFWNLVTGMIFGWNVSGHSLLPSVFKPSAHPPWGCFGPEESILMTIGALGAIAVLAKKLQLNSQLPGSILD